MGLWNADERATDLKQISFTDRLPVILLILHNVRPIHGLAVKIIKCSNTDIKLADVIVLIFYLPPTQVKAEYASYWL
jgi:hypothetical protein